MKSITIALNKTEYAILVEYAKEEGKSIYAFCKSAVLEEIANRKNQSPRKGSDIEDLKNEMKDLKKLISSKL